ncbi:hypothetical protein LTR56_017019 [Elasticomyces elasticus]|nr:hypothetical protein LTR56_017019 [Elasticomyces elasticus]KAK3636097.1 hypothetical protein LTR22_018855 [Elasticomyces elasticus]KAK4912134.1 hypothetical protein LTR49_019420 [Elasticomyces elasticus]KAK5753620.1 hypothetical protein LTS12_016257 [Elasticomyces elasticus]
MAGTQPMDALLPVRKASTTITQAVPREASKTTNEPLQTIRAQPSRASKHNTSALVQDLAEVKLPGKNVGSSVPIDMLFTFNYTTMKHQGAEHEVSAGYEMVSVQRRFNDIITLNLAYPVLEDIVAYINHRFNRHEYNFQNEQQKEQVAFGITAMHIQWDEVGEKVELCEANWQDICAEFRKLLFGQGVVMAKVKVECGMAG